MKHPVYIILVSCAIASMSMGAQGLSLDGGQQAPTDTSQPGGDDNNTSPHRAPIIISQFGASEVQFWAQPGDPKAILYPDWEIILFGSPEDPYMVQIGNGKTITGNLTGNYTSIEVKDVEGPITSMKATVGEQNWTFDTIIITRTWIDANDIIEEEKEKAKFTSSDIQRTALKTSAGATFLSVISIWIAWAVLKWRRMSRGVEHG
jgi:hypothetical protein